jgi:hypothetical protein
MPASAFVIEARAESASVGIFEDVGIDYVSSEISFPRRTREGCREQGGSIVTCRENYVWLSKLSIYPGLAPPIDWISACRLITEKLNPNLGDDAGGLSVVFDTKFELNQFGIIPHGQGPSVWPAKNISAFDFGNMLGSSFGGERGVSGGEPQRDSGEGKNDREDSNNRTMIFVSERSQAIDIDHEEV